MGREQGWGRTPVRSQEAGGTDGGGRGRQPHHRQGGPGDADRRGHQAAPRRRLVARVWGGVAVVGGAVVAVLEVVQVPGSGMLTRAVMDRGVVRSGLVGMPGPVVVTGILLMTGPVVMPAVVVMPGVAVTLGLVVMPAALVVPRHVQFHP